MSGAMRTIPNEIVNAGFNGTDPETQTGWVQPSAYVQWKGTDVCMDFHCECGAFCHFDGDFAYVVQCPHCLQKWEMPSTLYPRKPTSETYPGNVERAQMLERDEELDDEVLAASAADREPHP